MIKTELRKGVTLVELLIVVLILAALAAIAVPRISSSANSAKIKACDTNVDLMNTSIEMYNADELAYPTSLALVTGETSYFPDGVPVCPYGTAYVMNGTTSRVTAHSH